MRPEVASSADGWLIQPAVARPVLKPRRANSEGDAPRLSITPLSEPADILRRMPTQAISPALFELLEIMSSPMLLTANSPAGELIEMLPAKPVLKEAA